MAANELPPVVARLIADTAEFIAGFREAQAAVASFAMSTIEARDLAATMGQAMRESGAAALVDADAVKGVRDATAESVGSMESLGAVTAQTSAALAESAVSAEAATVAQRALTETIAAEGVAAGVYVDANGRMRDANGRFVASAEAAGAAAKREGEASAAGAGGLLSLKNAATAAVVATVAVGAAGVKMAADFQTATVRLVTSAGEVQSNLKMVQDGILQMSGQVGVSAMELANAMYYVESAGFQGADGLKVLTAAAQGAKAEGASTTDVVKAMTDVLKDYHLPATDAANVTSQMIAAVAHGKTSLSDFSKAFASIIPAASAAGISFADAGSALAEMTNHGFTAQRSAQNLAQALRSLLNPTKPMLAAFKEFGVSSDELKAKLAGPNGLTDSMQYLSTAALKAGKESTPAFAAALKLLMGTAPGANAALATVGANFADTTKTINAMTKATADGKGQVQGFAEVQGNFGQTMSRVKDAAAALVTKLGLELLPIVTKGGGIFAGFLSDVTSTLNGMSNSVGSFMSKVDLTPVINIFKTFADIIKNQVVPIVKDAATIIGPVLMVAFGVLVVAVRGAIAVVQALLTPIKGLFDFMAQHATVFQAIALSIGTVVVGLKAWALITTVMSKAQALWNAMVALGAVASKAYAASAEDAGIATKAWAAAQAVLDIAMDANPIMLIIIAVIALAAAFVYLWTHSAAFRNFFIGLWNDIKGAAEAVGKWFAGPFLDFFKDVGNDISGFVSDVLHWFSELPKNILNFFKNLPRDIGFAIGFLVGTLARVAVDAGKAFWTGITKAFDVVMNFFKDLPGNIYNFLKDADTWLHDTGAKVIKGMWNGIVDAAKAVWDFFKNLPQNLTNFFTNGDAWLHTPGMTVLKGLWSGIVDGAKAVWDWVKNFPSEFTGFFSDAGRWLWNVGSDIIRGLWNGISRMGSWLWNQITSFASGIIDGFQKAFHMSSPSKRMADEVGQHITSGIAQGMLGNMGTVHAAISQIGNTIAGANFGAHATTGITGIGTYGALAANNGGSVLVINNNIQGTVVGETQLSNVMRTQVLRYNQRNPTNGLSLFGRGTT